MNKHSSIIIAISLMILAACQKDQGLAEVTVTKKMTVKYFSVTGTTAYKITVNGTAFVDSLGTGQSVQKLVTADSQRIVIRDYFTQALVKDTLVATAGNKPVQIVLLDLNTAPGGQPQFITVKENNDTGKIINWAIYIDNAEGLFPDKVEIQLFRARMDDNWALTGEVDTLGTYQPINSNSLSGFLSIDLAKDSHLTKTTYPSPYMLELKDPVTGEFLPNARLDLVTLSSPLLDFYSYDRSIKFYISRLSAMKFLDTYYYMNTTQVTF